jgi:2-polyprenyl-3-methyl-5-hydroxy-6-metoxy-1,4-benzoquinol methylase
VIAPQRACPGCGSTTSHHAGEVHGFELRRCTGCRSLFTTHLPGPGEEPDYSGYYDEDGDLAAPAFVGRILDGTVGQLGPWRSANRWLDVGCGGGDLLRAAKRAGWHVAGTEVTPRPVRELSGQGFDVRLSELGEAGFEQASFDVVSAVEVLEHVRDPMALLAQARSLLRPDGALYLTTPNGWGLSARVLGLRWSVVGPPDHLQLLSILGLTALLDRAGFRVHTLRTYGVNPYELITGKRRRLTSGERVQTSRRLNQTLTESRSGRVAKTIVNQGLSAARLGDSIKLVATMR